MPEFGELLSLMEKLRMGVQLHSPETIGRMLRSAQYTEFENEDRLRLQLMLEDLIREMHGEQGVAQFRKGLRPPKKRFGLF